MRLAATLALLVGCATESEMNPGVPMCASTELGDVAPGAVGEAGVTPEAAVAVVDGASFEAAFGPAGDHTPAEAAFTSGATVGVTEIGAAYERLFEGGAPDIAGARCPLGPVLFVPVRLDVTLDVGGQAAVEGFVVSTGASADTTWVSGRGPLTGAPGWLVERAQDASECTAPEPTPDLEIDLRGAITETGTAWTDPRGGLTVTGQGDDWRCGRTVYTWTATLAAE